MDNIDTETNVNLSEIVLALDVQAKSRYIDKIKITGDIDPYTIPLNKLAGPTSSTVYIKIEYPDVQ